MPQIHIRFVKIVLPIPGIQNSGAGHEVGFKKAHKVKKKHAKSNIYVPLLVCILGVFESSRQTLVLF